MVLPEILGKPLFRCLYPLIRRMEGSPAAPIRRRVSPVDGEAAGKFDRLIDECLSGKPNQPIDYSLNHPKIDFLNYLCDWRGLVAHGSGLPDLEVLQPIRLGTDDNEFGNRRQVFCSPDATWAMWFAILDKNKFRTTRNGCIGIGSRMKREKYYHFELPEDLKEEYPFTSGTIYLAQALDFPSRPSIPALNFFGGEFEEWGSRKPVIPVARLRVEPEDFPYLGRVQYCIQPG